MFLQVSCLISNSSMQRGWADVIFLSLHIKAAMLLHWRDSLFRRQAGVWSSWMMWAWQRICLEFLLAPICMQVINKHKTIILWLDPGWSGTYVLPKGRAQDLNPPWKGRSKGLHLKPMEQQPRGMNKYSPWFQTRNKRTGLQWDWTVASNKGDFLRTFQEFILFKEKCDTSAV